MSKKTLYLHIGTNKTGTTTIQRFMSRNRQNLKAQGVLYPRKGATSGGNHSVLARNLQHWSQGSVSHPADWENFLKAAQRSKADRVIASGEVFWPFKGGTTYFDRFQQDLHAHFGQIYIVCYLRRQDEYLRSCYVQAVKSGRSPRSFREYMEVIALGKKTRAYEYDVSLALWADTFGEENIIVRPFEKSQLDPRGLVADFCQCCDVDFDVLDEDHARDVNVSPGRRVLAAMLYAQQLLPRVQGTTLRARRQTALCNAMAARLALDWKDKDSPFKGFAEGEARAFYQPFAEGNAEVARRYLRREDGKLFSEDRFAELKPGESDDVELTDAEREEIQQRVHALLLQLSEEGVAVD